MTTEDSLTQPQAGDAATGSESRALVRDAKGKFLPGNAPGPGRRKRPKPDPSELVIDLSGLDRKPGSYANDVKWVSQHLGRTAGKLRPPSQRAWTMFNCFNETDRIRRAFFERHAILLVKADAEEAAADEQSQLPRGDDVVTRMKNMVARINAAEEAGSSGTSTADCWPYGYQ